MNTAAIALAAVTFGTFINSTGYIFFKFANVKSEKRNCNYVLTWEYVVGLACMIAAAVINVGE